MLELASGKAVLQVRLRSHSIQSELGKQILVPQSGQRRVLTARDGHVVQRISEPRGACTWGASSRCTRPRAAPSPPSPEPSPLQREHQKTHQTQTGNRFQPPSAKSQAIKPRTFGQPSDADDEACEGPIGARCPRRRRPSTGGGPVRGRGGGGDGCGG